MLMFHPQTRICLLVLLVAHLNGLLNRLGTVQSDMYMSVSEDQANLFQGFVFGLRAEPQKRDTRSQATQVDQNHSWEALCQPAHVSLFRNG